VRGEAAVSDFLLEKRRALSVNEILTGTNTQQPRPSFLCPNRSRTGWSPARNSRPPIHVLNTSSAPMLLSVEGVATIEVGRKQQSGQKRMWVFSSSRGCGFCLFRLMLWRFVDWTHVSWMRG